MENLKEFGAPGASPSIVAATVKAHVGVIRGNLDDRRGFAVGAV